jgi:hypothetical protein
MNDNFPNVHQAAVVVLRWEGSDTAYKTLHDALIAWDRLAERSKTVRRSSLAGSFMEPAKSTG